MSGIFARFAAAMAMTFDPKAAKDVTCTLKYVHVVRYLILHQSQYRLDHQNHPLPSLFFEISSFSCTRSCPDAAMDIPMSDGPPTHQERCVTVGVSRVARECTE
jgi:hypothetical protein